MKLKPIGKQSRTRESLVSGVCEITPLAPYDLSLAASFFRQRSVAEDRVNVDGDCDELTLFTVLGGAPTVIKAKNNGSVESPVLEVNWRELSWSVAFTEKDSGDVDSPVSERLSQADIIEHLRKVLSLDVDLSPFYETLAEHQQLKNLKSSFLGFKPALTSTVFDAAMWAIVGQQVTLGFALTLKERLARSYGRPFFGKSFVCDGKELFASPTAAALASTDVQSLRTLQLSQSKTEYVLTLARAVTEGALDLEGLRLEPYEQACEKLISLRGIGKWSANYILMRGAGHLDALPLGDAGLRRAIRRAYDLSEAPSDDEISKLAEPFRPYRSLFTLYLWQGFA